MKGTTEVQPKKIIKAFGWIGMGIIVLVLISTILVVFNSPTLLRPDSSHYFYATIIGGIFGFFLGLFAYWMHSGKWVSGTKTLRIALAITTTVSSSVFLWVYALAIAGINKLGHPVWASVLFGLTTLALCVWAARHQLNFQKK